MSPLTIPLADRVWRPFFLTVFHSDRQHETEEYIKHASIPHTIIFEHWWVNWTRHNDSARHLLFPPDEYRDIQALRPADFTWGEREKDPDLAAKFFFSLRFFLQNTTASWFYRGTDDAVINFEKLGTFLIELEKEKDPLKDFVFLGNCVRNDPWTFPQGGSGFIISRAAVEFLEPLARRFISTMMQPEDVAFQPFLESFNISMSSITSRFFCGHNFGWDNLLKIKRHEWEDFDVCPPQEGRSTQFCKPFLSPIRDIVFYHEWMGIFQDSRDNAKAVFAADPHLMWYIDGMHPQLCKIPREGSQSNEGK